METDGNYPAQFKNVIEKIIDAELNKRGITKYISALVKGVNDDGTVNVCIPPNLDSIISGLLNKTGEALSEGDSVELCAKNGSVNNSWVAIKHKTNTQFAGVNTPNTFTQNQTFNENIITKNVVSKNLFNINGYVAQQYSTRISVKNNTARVTCLGNGQNMYSCIKIENINELLGKTCTFKAIATSSSSNVPMARIYFGTDNAPATESANFDLYGETSNTQITLTFPANMPSGCDGAYVLLYGNRNGTGFSAGAYVDYTDIQLEISFSATSYAPYLNLEELMPLLPVASLMTVNEEYVYTSDLSYIVVRIGKIVILNIRTIAFKSEAAHGAVLITGLPPAKNGVIFYLYGGHAAAGTSVRVALQENGTINIHYSSIPQYGDSPNKQYSGTLIYETN